MDTCLRALGYNTGRTETQGRNAITRMRTRIRAHRFPSFPRVMDAWHGDETCRQHESKRLTLTLPANEKRLELERSAVQIGTHNWHHTNLVAGSAAPMRRRTRGVNSVPEGTQLPTMRILDLLHSRACLHLTTRCCSTHKHATGRNGWNFVFDGQVCTAIGVTDRSLGDKHSAHMNNCFHFSCAKDVHGLFRGTGREPVVTRIIRDNHCWVPQWKRTMQRAQGCPGERNGCKNSGKIWWQHGDSHASSSHEVSLEPTFKRREDLGKHSVKTHFPKDRNCEICQRTKITRAPYRRRVGGAVPRAENFGDLITANHKVLSDNCESRNNHRYAIVVQDLATQWIQAYPCKTKTSQETQRSLQKFLEPDRKPKVIYSDNSLEFGKACEDLSWSHCTSTPHRSETNGVAERAVRRVKEGTSAVLLQSGLNENWWADSMECYTCLWWEDALWKTFWATIYRTDYSIWFIGWVSPCNCEGPVKNPSIWKESLTWIVPRIRIVRGGNLEGWRTGRRPWGVGDDGRIGNLLEKTQCETGDISQRKRRIHFSSRGESHLDFLGESEGSLPPPHDSFPDAGEAINDFWSMSGNFKYRHHVEPRVKLYSPREESFPTPLKYIHVSRTANTNLDVKQERRIDDYWNIDGSRDLSDSWTGFTQFTLLEKKLQTDFCGPGRD